MPSLPQHQQTQRSQCFHPTGTFLPFSRDDLTQSLPARFERQVEQYPTHLAVQTPSQQVTYTVLNEAANGVAQAILAQRGTTAEPIALLLASGVSLITAILGVLKTGKSYVPLDPAYPQAQLAATLADAQPGLLLTQRQHMALARSLTAHVGGVLDIDTDTSPSAHNPALTIAPETLAYIFYTSGSTGRPKGVMDTHSNVLHNIMRYTNTLHFCAADRMTLLQSCSFSGSVSSLFGALLNGATIFPYEVAQVGTPALAAWMAQEALTIYHSVPAIFRQVMTAGYAFPTLRLVRLEGDRASPQDIALYHQQCPPHCLLVNGLGATECGLVRQYFVDKTTPVPDRLVPIGYAVPDMEVLVCDEDGNEVEPEVPGALVIRSRYLSPGYWQRPELTAATFAEDAQERSVRLYRTGDLGRRLPDGCIEHLGR